jgi:hypothetical protein
MDDRPRCLLWIGAEPGFALRAIESRGATCRTIRKSGAPLGNRPHDLIRNVDQRSKDYSEIARTFRPGHADYTYLQKYGLRDPLARAPSKSLVVMDHGDLVGMLTGDGPPHAHAGSS